MNKLDMRRKFYRFIKALKLSAVMVVFGFAMGIYATCWYQEAVKPVVVYAAQEPEPEPKVIQIELDYTGWTKERIQKEIRAHLPEVFIEIARCESQTRQYNRNGDLMLGVVDPDDWGVLQINVRYHGETAKKMGIDLTTPVGNVAFAKHLYETQGLQPWSASASCWK